MARRARFHARSLVLSLSRLQTPLDKAREANQKAIVQLLESWPTRLKRRNEVTAKLREKLDKYTKDVQGLTKTPAASAEMRKLVREAENAGRPRVKAHIIADTKALLMRAEH